MAPEFVYLNKKNLEKSIKKINNNKNLQFLIGNSIKFSPISGFEPKYEPKKWNLNPRIKDNHNCFSYAINQRVSNRIGKAQPGYFSGFPHVANDEYKCGNFIERLKSDIPSMYMADFGTKCKDGFYKIYMAIDKSSDPDYHFYRQDSNGMWSHKPGRTDVVDIDAAGKKIMNPAKADRNYKSVNYEEGCMFACINPRLARSHSRQRK